MPDTQQITLPDGTQVPSEVVDDVLDRLRRLESIHRSTLEPLSMVCNGEKIGATYRYILRKLGFLDVVNDNDPNPMVIAVIRNCLRRKKGGFVIVPP